MLAYIPYMDPMGYEQKSTTDDLQSHWICSISGFISV